MPYDEQLKISGASLGLMAGLANIQTTPYAQISISKVVNGFIVNVACKQFVAKTWDEVSLGLELYFKDPKEAEKRYCK